MSRILELIGGWKEGICSESRWKEDLGNIRDMHRLLTFKGYRFRDTQRSNNAAVAATANLKSAEELEEEDRAAQSAKLQELIRRGTPRDLAAAQELMKSLAGANPDAKPDYRSQALTELNKLEQKVILLNEMLDNVDTQRGEKFASGDAYDQVASILTTARPKLQKWISDAETEDPESLDTFLQINDQINTVLQRYEAFKKGDYTFASNPVPQELAGSSSGAAGGLSLIDFDDSAPAAAPSNGAGGNDLSGLFSTPQVQQPVQQQAFGLGMGMGVQSQQTFGMGLQQPQFQQSQFQPPQYQQPHAPIPTVANGFNSAATMASGPSHSSTPPASIMLPGTPGSQKSTPAPANQAPSYFVKGPTVGVPMNMGMGQGFAVTPFGGSPQGQAQQQMYGGSPQPPMGMGMGGMGMGMMGGLNSQQGQFGAMQPLQAQQQSQSPQSTTAANTTATQKGKDPFADLAGLF